MSNVKGSAALVIAAAAMIMFLTGCETTKHAEVMSAEELAAQAQASDSQGSGTGSGGEQGGIPLAGQGMSEGSLSVGDSSGAAAGTGSSELSLASINPEGPPSPTLRDVSGASMGNMGGGTIADSRGSGAGMSDGMEGGTDTRTQPSRSDLSDFMSEYPTGNRGPSAYFGTEPPPQAYLRDPADPSASASAGESMSSSGAGMTESTVDAGPTGYEGQQFVRALAPSDFVPEGPPQPFVGDAVPSSGEAGEEIVQLPKQETMEPLVRADLGGTQGEGASGMDDGGGVRHAYFDFDRYVIRQDAIAALEWNAHLLTAKYPKAGLLIEGHCDERGTTDYNLVLGERRAKAVKNYLVDLGVLSWRIQIVSYGKERPSCTESEESCWQQNRRGHVVLQ